LSCITWSCYEKKCKKDVEKWKKENESPIDNKKGLLEEMNRIAGDEDA